MVTYIGNQKDPNHLHQDILGKQLYNEIVHNDCYELKQFFKKCSRNIDTIIDIGSNVGYFSLLSSILYPHAKKILVEPNPENVKVLEQNFKDFSNISIIPKALGDGSKVKMKFDDRWSGSDSVITDENGNIETLGIMDIIPKNVGNYILKVDCEGGERYLLNANPSIFNKCIYFISEFHENENNNLNIWENWLKTVFSKNYKVIKKYLGKDMQNNLYLFYANRTSRV